MSHRLKYPSHPDIILAVIFIIVVFIIPGYTSFKTGCLFNRFTGLYCAGCGMSRGIHALLRGDFFKAMHYNILLVTAVPASLLWLVVRFCALRYSDKIKKYDKAVIVFFIIIVILFSVLRNIYQR